MAKAGILQTIETSGEISALLSMLTQLAYGEITSDEAKAWLEEQHPDHRLDYLLDQDGADGKKQSGSLSDGEHHVHKDSSGRKLMGEEIRRWLQCNGPLPKEYVRIGRLSRTTPQVLLQSLRLRIAIELLKTVVINSRAFGHMSASEQHFVREFPEVEVGFSG